MDSIGDKYFKLVGFVKILNLYIKLSFLNVYYVGYKCRNKDKLMLNLINFIECLCFIVVLNVFKMCILNLLHVLNVMGTKDIHKFRDEGKIFKVEQKPFYSINILVLVIR